MPKHAITMGIAVSLSGRYRLLGRQVLEGLECYVRDVNAAGGLRLATQGTSLPISLMIEDDESSEGKIRLCIEKLIDQDKVDILIGPYGSGLTLAAAEVADARQTMLWEQSTVAADLPPNLQQLYDRYNKEYIANVGFDWPVWLASVGE